MRFTLRTMFNSWFSQFASIDKKRQQKQLGIRLKKRIYTRRCLAIWRRKFDLIMLKRSLEERKIGFLREVTKRKYLERWIFMYQTNCTL